MANDYLARVKYEIHELMAKPLTPDRIRLMADLLRIKKYLLKADEHAEVTIGGKMDVMMSKMEDPSQMMDNPGQKSYFGGNQ